MTGTDLRNVEGLLTQGGIQIKPVCTNMVMRIMYTAVNDVARRVGSRAQVFR